MSLASGVNCKLAQSTHLHSTVQVFLLILPPEYQNMWSLTCAPNATGDVCKPSNIPVSSLDSRSYPWIHILFIALFLKLAMSSSYWHDWSVEFGSEFIFALDSYSTLVFWTTCPARILNLEFRWRMGTHNCRCKASLQRRGDIVSSLSVCTLHLQFPHHIQSSWMCSLRNIVQRILCRLQSNVCSQLPSLLPAIVYHIIHIRPWNANVSVMSSVDHAAKFSIFRIN